MGDTNRDPRTEETPQPDDRSDLEQIVESRSDAADAAKGGETASPLDPTGIPDGVGGTAGVTKNQDADAQ